MYLTADFGQIGIIDLEYRFYDVYNSPIGDIWISTGILEEKENGIGTGIYSVNAVVPDDAISIRWRSHSDPVIRAFGELNEPRVIKNPKGIVKLDEDHFRIRWDTRGYLNGDANIEAFSLGSDGLWARDEVIVEINNTITNNIIYKEYPFQLGRDNYKIVKPHFGIESYALHASPLRRGWLQLGVRVEGTTLPNGFTPELAETWWKQFKIVPLEKGVSWTVVNNKLTRTFNINNAVKTQLHNNSTLDKPSAKLWYGIKVTPFELMTGFDLKADSVFKIRMYEAGKYVIITKNPTKIYIYDGTILIEKIDLSTYGYLNHDFSDALDVTYFENKIYIVTYDGKLAVIDTEENHLNYIFIPTSENKQLKWVEASKDGLVAIYRSDESTSAYALNDLKLLWELDKKVTSVKLQEENLVLLVNGDTFYYSTSRGIDAPLVDPFSDTQDNFPHPIIDYYSPVAMLDNGEIFEKKLIGGWTKINTIIPTVGKTLTSISYARVGEDYQRAFFGQTGDNLIEMFADNTTSDSRTLEITGYTSEDITSIPQMWHFEKIITQATGALGSPDYAPPVYDDRLLIGTTSPVGSKKGLLVVLEKSPLNEAGGAILVSSLNKPDIYPEEVLKV